MPRVAACPDVRKAVLDAAQDLMQRYGYKKMTINDIASEVGIGKATLYGYFANKQEVAMAVVDHYHFENLEGWRSIDSKPFGHSEKLREMILFRVMYFFEVAQRHRQSLDECFASLRPIVFARRDHYMEVESGFLAQILQAGMEIGEFTPEDSNELARTILTCSGGLMPFNLSPKELTSSEKVIEKTHQVCDLILRAIQTRERSSVTLSSKLDRFSTASASTSDRT